MQGNSDGLRAWSGAEQKAGDGLVQADLVISSRSVWCKRLFQQLLCDTSVVIPTDCDHAVVRVGVSLSFACTRNVFLQHPGLVFSSFGAGCVPDLC